MISHEDLLKTLRYEPETGKFFWLIPKKGRRVGDEAGKTTNAGYRLITINKKGYLAHRLAWFYVNKCWPEDVIDHINRNPLDNRIINLRAATRTQNNYNASQHANKTSGLKGVSWNRQRGAWSAQCKANGLRVFLGYFHDVHLAKEAYNTYMKSAVGEFFSE